MNKLILTALILTLCLCSCTKLPPANDDVSMVIGTYTDSGSYGIYSVSFDQETGTYTMLDSIKAVNPSYLIFSADSTIIYAVNEVDDNQGGVSSIKYDKANGTFNLLNGTATGSGAPCYLATNGRILATANYGGGSLTVFPIAENGTVLPVDTLYVGSVGGPDSTRQESPHVHCVEFTPDGKYLFASDFSADRLLAFEVVEEGHKLIPLLNEKGDQVVVPVESDYGPRHIIFDESGKHAYVIGELSGKVTVFDYNDGRLTQKQIIDGDPYDGRGSSDIHLSPDGRYLYTSNRLKGDGINIFEVNTETGELTQAGYQLTGPHPRHFNITPNGKWMLVACRDSNEIEVYAIDKKTGLLSPTDTRITIPKPVCVQFLP